MKLAQNNDKGDDDDDKIIIIINSVYRTNKRSDINVCCMCEYKITKNGSFYLQGCNIHE